MSVTLIRVSDGLPFTFDNAIAEFYEPSVLVTNHPVEEGVDVTDHAQRQPLPFAIRVLQTETPLGPGDGPDGAARLLAAIEYLRNAEGQLLDVVTTKFGTITNCLIESYPHEVSVRRDLPITVRMKQVRIATAQSVIIPPEVPVDSASVGFPDAQDVGIQATDDSADEPAKEADDQSVLFGLLSSTGAL